jgi:multidrug efflux pump subunit AcrA (membrane-fusion protein)
MQKSIDALKRKIDRLTIVSPVDGYIISKDAEAAQTIAAQQPVVTIVDTKNLWVKANVDERISGMIKKGQRVDIVLRSQDGTPLTGYVERIEAKSDPVTEERIVDVAFDKAPFPFHINEQAEVSIETGRLHDVVLVPRHLIRHGGVWVYNDGEAHFKKVEILGKNDKEAAVDGLAENEKILVPDSHKKPLFDGVDIRL